MAHELTIRKNKTAEMAYVGEKPWHGLGQELVDGADLETWRQAAGMDWQIKRSRVRYGDETNPQIFDDHHVLFRSGDKKPLAIVSPKYKIVQPGEVLEFFRDLTEVNGFKLNTAGTLFGGRRFWALASVGKEATVVGDDKIGGFLLLSSSCDGTLATTAQFTTVRVVCNNTLSMALHAKDKKCVTVSHRSHFDPAAMKDELGIARDHFGEFLKATRQLAKVRLDNVKAEAFVESLLHDTKTVLKDDVRQSKQFTKVMDLFKGSAMGGTLVSAEGTAWGLVNSVTEFVDHHARASSVDHRMANAWFGRGDDLKTVAFERALTL